MKIARHKTNVYPVYEMRPPKEAHDVFRFNCGNWIPDDGEWDLAFYGYGTAPMAWYVDLPYHKNIAWSGLTTHWSGCVESHPGGNAWHYMLKGKTKTWGDTWDRDYHENKRAGDKAMDACCAKYRCANGRGPEFRIGDPFIQDGLLRNRETKQIVTFPEKFTCMYCGIVENIGGHAP